MVAFQIREVKKFMAKLLGQNDFDDFFVSEAEVMMAAGYKINGHRNKNFYSKRKGEKGLKKQNRIYFVRRYWYGESIAEIATAYRVSEEKVKSSLFRTRNQLKLALERKGI